MSILKLFLKCFIIACIILVIPSCKKFLEVSFPVTSANAAVVYNTDAQAIGVITGVYAKMSKNNLQSAYLPGISLFAGLSSDELSLYDRTSTILNPNFSNTLSGQFSSTSFWTTIYPVIFTANSALEGLHTATDLTPSVNQQLTGEAKFIRAYCYFYLANLYGDVPLALSTDYKINSLLARTPKVEIYNQIIEDLKDAQNLLSSNYLNGSLQTYSSGIEKLRPTKWAATSLLARCYLYLSDWSNAEIQASTVLSNNSFSLDTLNGVFLKNSKEAIWQLQPVFGGSFTNTMEGALFVLPTTGPSFSYPVYLSDNVVNSFEFGDKRKDKWVANITISSGGTPIKYYYPYKYKIGQGTSAVSEYSMVLRLAELYLIRAEARAQLGNINGSLDDLNIIRNRAGLPNYSGSTDKETLVSAILHERQVELFAEWGHRWLDLKRTGTIDSVMSNITPLKGGIWESTDQLYPIPQVELDRSPNLRQNDGY